MRMVMEIVTGWSLFREVAAMVVKRRCYQCQMCRPIVCWAAASAELHCPSHSSIIVCCLVKISGWLQSQEKDNAAKNSFIGKTDADKTKENAKVSFQGKTPLLHARWGLRLLHVSNHLYKCTNMCRESSCRSKSIIKDMCFMQSRPNMYGGFLGPDLARFPIISNIHTTNPDTSHLAGRGHRPHHFYRLHFRISIVSQQVDV